ncbi:MAG: transporter substrate-binding domain-containing protein [Clostridia bacterium]|nr:transporter substrate-binding domain-containing protein [Clostridia bacterium]
MMKRVIALLAIAMLMLTMTACGGDKTDSEYVKDKGTLVVGITDFAPMDYQNEDGEWIGFDADLAKAFAESLGVEVEFSVITWGQKHSELEAKNIDVVWNGMTITDEVKGLMDVSNAYCENAQVVVMTKENAAKYTTVESMKELRFAVEDGSAGEEMAEENGFTTVPVEDQAMTLMEVKSGTSDAAVIDMLMAGAMIGEGTDYADLVYTLELNSEEYGVGFRKGSDLVQLINEFFVEAYADGTITELANTYKIADNVIEQK